MDVEYYAGRGTYKSAQPISFLFELDDIEQ